jgi:hypothetical protein
MNWGKKIAVLYLSFVALIVAMVAMAMNQKVDLVASDYYEQEIKYQGKINKIERTKMLNSQLIWKVENTKITFEFPKESNGKTKSGYVNFFRPSDAELDQKTEFKNDTLSNQTIDITMLKKGVYKMQIDWKVEDIEYYNEGIVQIQ